MTNETDRDFDPFASDMEMETDEFEAVYSRFLGLVIESNLNAEQIRYLFGFIDNVAALDLQEVIEERSNQNPGRG